MRAQPLIPLSLLFAAGIAAARLFDPGPASLLAALAASLALLLRFKILGLALLAASLGASICWARFAIFSEHDLRVLVGDEPAIVSVRGDLSETPQIREFDETGVSTARLRIREILLNGAWQPATGEIMTRTRGELNIETLYQGQRVEVNGVVQRPASSRAPGLFDRRRHLRNQRIYFELRTESPELWTISDRQPMPKLERLRRWAKAQIARGLPDDEPTRMLWAMTLGWRTALSGEMAAPFMRTGTAHIVAVSGLHVACIAIVLTWGMRLLGFSRPHYVWVVPALLWAYTAATGWQSSGIRSALMATTVFAGWAARRPAALLNSLAAAGLILLVFQPEQLFQTGFQLSFAVVAAIGAIVPFLEAKLPMEWRADPFLPRPLWPAWKKNFNRLTMYLRPNLRITLASFVGSLPLTACYFNLVAPVSLLANLVVVPLSSLALTFSMLSLVTPFLGEFWNFLAWAAMWETIQVTHWFDRWGWHRYVPTPGPAAISIYLLLIAWTLAGGVLPKRVRIAGWSLLAASSLSASVALRAPPKLHVLPVAGASVFVDRTGAGSDLLIDCSNGFDYDHVVRPFLRAQGVNRVALALTHGDIQHLGAFAEFASEFRPPAVHTSPHPSRSPSDKAARAILADMPRTWRPVARGDSVSGFQVLHPPRDRKFSRADDNALVLKTSIQGWRVLIVSDLGRDGLRELIASDQPLDADILVVGASADDGRLSENLVHRVSPRIIVFDPGRYNSSEPPEAGAPVLVPAECGAVTFEFERGGCRVRCANGSGFALSKQTTSEQPE